jgi:putative transcriptional regulator
LATGDEQRRSLPGEQVHPRQKLIEIVRWARLLQIVSDDGAMAETSKSLKGKLLLDGGKLQGSFFSRTVVLICEHDSEGAFGLVLNRPSENCVGELISGNLSDALKEHTLFVGGPVQPGALSYLHSEGFLADANVMPNLNLGHSLDTLTELTESFSPTQKVRIFAGYAGWSPGQLDDEMKRGAWLMHPASLDLVFDSDPKQLWQSILRKKGWEFKLLADAPEDLSWT